MCVWGGCLAVSSRAGGLHHHLSLRRRGNGFSPSPPTSSIRGVDRHHQLCASCHCNGFSPSPPMSSISAADRSSMHVQRLSPSPPFACARAVCLLIITAANFSSSRHLSSLPRSLFWLKPGAARMEAARSSQNQPEAPRSTQRHPAAPRSTQEQPGATRRSQK